MAPAGLDLAVAYAEASLCPQISYHRTFKEIRVTAEKKLFIEKQPAGSDMVLGDAQQIRLHSLIYCPDRQAIEAGACADERLADRECITPGLQDYF